MKLSYRNICIDVVGERPKRLCSNISFEVSKGEVLGILGESGSGKSITTMACMNLLHKSLQVSDGEILLGTPDNEVNLLLQSEDSWLKLRGKKIAVVFQDPMLALNPSKKCGEQVLEMILNHQKMSKNQALNQALEGFKNVELPDPQKTFESYPHEISGGQQQRVVIAMAIANKPDFLIADEPTTALDPTVQEKIVLLLKQIQQKYGMGLLFISHDIGLVKTISDRIAIFKLGELVEQGITQEVIKNPKHAYTKKLLDLHQSMDQTLHLPTFSDHPQSIIELENIEIRYPLKSKKLFGKAGYFKAIDELSFSIHKQDSVGIVGESGSGKTTLGRAVMNLLKVSRGNIKLEGRNIVDFTSRDWTHFRKKVQLIFQDPYSSLNPKQTIGNLLGEALLVHKLVTRSGVKLKVLDMLKQVQLSGEFYERYPHQLSGGQRQRVVIARALLLEPEIIVCDEAVSALDVSTQFEILNLLIDLKKTYNLTFLFISHDLNVTKFFCNKVMVLKQGQIIEAGDAKEVLSNPKQRYTQELIDSSQFKNLQKIKA